MAARTNVVSIKTYSHIQWTFILTLLFICQQYETAEESSFITCILDSRSFISELRKDDIFNCSKFLNVSGCSDYYMHKYPGTFSHSDINHLSIEKFCIQNVTTRSNVSWSCIARHSFRLLTCLANISSSIFNNVHEDGIIKETCRKSLEFSECPSKVLLSTCGEKSVEAVKDIIEFSVNYFMPLSCRNTNIKHALKMPVNYFLEQDIMELARCFDSRLIEINACFLQNIQNERDLQGFVCGYDDGDSFKFCIEFLVTQHCKLAVASKKLLLKLFSFGGITCQKPQFAFKHLSPHQSQNSLTTDSFPDVEMDEHSQQFSLNDEIYTPGSLHETSTSKVTAAKELFPSKNVTSNANYDFNHNVNSSKLFKKKDTTVKFVNSTSELSSIKIHAVDSFLKNHTENQSYKDVNFQASKGTNLFCDKIIYCTLFLFIILKSIQQLNE